MWMRPSSGLAISCQGASRWTAAITSTISDAATATAATTRSVRRRQTGCWRTRGRTESAREAIEGSEANEESGERRSRVTWRRTDSSSWLGARHLGQAEAFEGGVVGAQVTGREAVGDDRAAADVGLEHGQAGGRVDHRVGGRHPVAHLLGEAEDADLLVVAEALLELLAGDLVAAGDADDQGVLVGERRARSRPRGRRSPSRRRRRGRPERGRGRRAPRGRRGGCAASGTRARSAGATHSTVPGPTSLSTSSIDSGWVT